MQLQSSLAEIRNLGTEIWAIAPDSQEPMKKLRDDEGLEFPILLDPELQATKRWGLLNEESGKVPHPTAVIVDRAGVIRYLRVDADYKVRPDPAELLAALRELVSASDR